MTDVFGPPPAPDLTIGQRQFGVEPARSEPTTEEVRYPGDERE